MNEKNTYPSAGILSYFEPESVCGQDSRYHVWQTNTVPYFCVSHLLITFDEGLFVGSAFLVLRTEDYLVFATSGHCVYANGKFANKIEVTPALNVDDKPYGAISVESNDLRASDGWKAGGMDRAEFDYGAILAPVNSDVAVMPMTIMSNEELEGRVISNCGYPADKPHGTMWWCGGPIEVVEERMMRYMADTYGGQSGSPIFTWSGDNLFQAVGIHGYGGCPNGAVRITEPVMADFTNWSSS